MTALAVLAVPAREDVAVSGVVLRSGEPAAGATIVLLSESGGATFAGGADSEGAFRITAAPPGRYELWAALEDVGVSNLEVDVPAAGVSGLRIDIATGPGARSWSVDPADQAIFREATLKLADSKVLDALQDFQEFLEKYPYVVKANYNVALCYVELASEARAGADGDLLLLRESLAREHFGVVLQRYPDFSPALIGMGESYVRTLEMDKAEETYAKLLRVAPDDPALWYTFGEVLSWNKKLEEAEAAFRRVLELQPSYVDALARIGAIEYVRGDYAAAVRSFEQFLKAAPDSDMAPRSREMLEEARKRVAEGK